MFRIYVEAKILEYIEGVPFLTQAVCYSDWNDILNVGLTGLFPGDVRFLGRNRFEIDIVVEEEFELLRTGLVLKGKFSQNNEGGADYYINAGTSVLDNKLISAFPLDSALAYKEIDKVFLKEKEAIEQLRRAYFSLPINSPFQLAPRVFKNRFYEDLEHVKAWKAHSDRFGSHISTDSDMPYTDKVVSVNGEKIRPLVDRLKRKFSNPFIIVNFIDHQDEFFHAQIDLLRLSIFTIKKTCPSIEVSVVNVSIKGRDGVLNNQEEYLHYFDKSPESWGMNLKPFSMLFFRPEAVKKGAKYRKYKTLYFDLFEGCMDEDLYDKKRNRRFRINRDVIVHDLNASALCATSLQDQSIRYVDLRDKSNTEVEHMIDTLAKDVIVIELGKDIK